MSNIEEASHSSNTEANNKRESSSSYKIIPSSTFWLRSNQVYVHISLISDM